LIREGYVPPRVDEAAAGCLEDQKVSTPFFVQIA
jgi:hypothetical protein